MFIQMVERCDAPRLSDILKAASDPTRRSILTTLVQEGPTRVTDLAEHYAMSLNSVSKHIKVLESAGLVSRRTLGRVHLIEAELEPLREIDRWFRDLRSIWDMRLEKLDEILQRSLKVSDLSLTVARSINAPIEAVFNAWLDPAMLARFMIPGDGMSVPKAEADAREGGRFSIIMLAGENELPHGGVFKTIRRHSQIVFSWESPVSVEGSTVTLNFSEKAGGTEVELIHVIFADEEKRDNHLGGWTAILAKLDEILT